jgi:hypothetical protein
MNSVTAARSARSMQTTSSEKSNEPVRSFALSTCGNWRIAASNASAVVVGPQLDVDLRLDREAERRPDRHRRGMPRITRPGRAS